MKSIKPLILAVTGLAFLSATSQAQLSLNFSSSPGGAPNGGAYIEFNGSSHTFQFIPASLPYSIPNPPNPPITVNYYVGSQWSITTETGPSQTGSAIGLLGAINTGPFSYGAITTTGTEQDATINPSPSGQLVINAPGGNLTGTINWIDLATYNSGASAGLTINLTGLSYLGSNPDLQTLVTLGSGAGGMTIGFQFQPGMSLSQLSTGSGPYLTSFSGSISAVPEPSTMFLSGIGGLGVLLLRRRNRGIFSGQQ